MRFLFLLVSLGCNYSFAENIHQKKRNGKLRFKSKLLQRKLF